jgi:uncharacterized protein YqjF (DUF2071 family)
MVTHDFNTGIVNEVAHRPWPMLDTPWVMTQTWHDLLFAHWPVDQSQLRSQVPAMFDLDLFDGTAWLGVVPFHMTNVAPRGVPSLPWISEFPELNVRTYVRVGNRPGVYFFSLDAGSALAAQTARTLLNLPYHAATMSVAPTPTGVDYRSTRHSNPSAEFIATYGPAGEIFFRPTLHSSTSSPNDIVCITLTIRAGLTGWRSIIRHGRSRLRKRNFFATPWPT